MNYCELIGLADDKREICVWGTGGLGKGDAYLFLKNVLEPKKKVAFFCDNYSTNGVEVVDGIKTIEKSYLYKHIDEVLCIIAIENKDIQREITAQLESMGIKSYTMDSKDIFEICNIMLNKPSVGGVFC
jgi:siroheme synthase (precorrin-2 oxidase/ferrochelatase)